jgi:hypothetical protein
MFLKIEHVQHVGSLDPTARTDQPSLEGPCLSVSVNPEEWGYIARTAGPVWDLTCKNALWLDACNLNDAERDKILDWAVSRDLIRPVTLWRAWYLDGESDQWCHFLFENEQQARNEVDEDEYVDADIPSDSGTLVDSVPGWKLSEAAMNELERWGSALDGEEGAVILYAKLKLAPEMPELAGIWWDELYNPLSLSCPRGGILPDRLDMFDIRDEYGAQPPFRQKQPDNGPGL